MILIFNAVLIICGIPWYFFIGRHRPVRVSMEDFSAVFPDTLSGAAPVDLSTEIKPKPRP
jgi:hypothetical protein